MTRFLLNFVLPLALPFVVYIGWRLITRGRPGLANVSGGPWFWLIGAGLVLTIAGLITLAVFPYV